MSAVTENEMCMIDGGNKCEFAEGFAIGLAATTWWTGRRVRRLSWLGSSPLSQRDSPGGKVETTIAA